MIGPISRAIRAIYERRRSTKMSENERKKSKAEAQRVVFQVRDDGMQPSTAPWGFLFRSPLPVSLPPGRSMQLNLLVAADTPMFLWPTRTHTDDVRIEGPSVLSPSNEVIVMISNSSKTPLEIEAGESLVCGHPFFFSGTGEVG